MQTLLTRDEVAQYLNVTRSYLDHAAVAGMGPPFVRMGRRLVRYKRAALDALIASRRAVTAEVAA